MKKKKSGGGGANWQDTYGDMVTLLLCFFVLLYSMSTISEDKWRALVTSFNPNAVQTPTETPGGEGPDADKDEGDGPLSQEAIDQQMDELYEQIQEFVEQENRSQDISVFKDNGKVFVTFNQTVFFDGDSAVLREESKPILDSVSDILRGCADAIDEIRVVGHTAQARPDKANDPHTDRMLSSMRSTNVVVYIQEQNAVDPGRLISEGVGQWRPVASNDTPEERAQNRHVEMIISGRDLEKELQGGIVEYHTES